MGLNARILNHMVEYMSQDKNQETLSQVFKALSDPTRRSMLARLCQEGPMRVTDLACLYEISLNGVSKHVKALEAAGLVERRLEGRTHWIEGNLDKLEVIENWVNQSKSIWEQRLDRLSSILEQESVDE